MANKVYLDLTFNGLSSIDLSWLEFCLYDCQLQLIDLRSNQLQSVSYSGEIPVIPGKDARINFIEDKPI